jgi:hypothetical protein
MLEDIQVAFVEAYTPSSNQIVSPFLNKPLEYAFFQTSVDCDITVRCYGGNTQTITVKGGTPYPIAVTRITAISTGVVYILHNGK